MLNDFLQKELYVFDPASEIEKAKTPPASWYRHEDFLALEKERVFRQHWAFVGHDQSLQNSGDYFTGNFFKIPYIITRLEDGSIQGLYNVCSHHGTCVAKGSGRTESFTCPYHGWNFALNGQLKKAPRAGALGYARTQLALKTFPVMKWGPFLFANFSGRELEPPKWSQLKDDLEAMHLDELTFVGRKEYRLNCNWKIFIDNYLDGGYHVPVMHPGLSQQLELDGYHSKIFSDYSIQYCENSPSAEASAKDFPGRLQGPAIYGWIYPNFALNRYGKWLDTNWVVPLTSDECLVVFDYYHHGPISEEDQQRAFLASEQVQIEDTEICDMVQAGLESGIYQQGIYAPQYEQPMFHFHQLLFRDLSS